MRREAKVAKKQQPYIYDQYNVSAYQMGNSKVSNFFTRILCSFMEGVNKHRLPRLIIMMIDHDMLKGLKAMNRPGVSNDFGRCIEWLTKKLENIIELKKDDMFYKRAKSLNPNEPKFI